MQRSISRLKRRALSALLLCTSACNVSESTPLPAAAPAAAPIAMARLTVSADNGKVTSNPPGIACGDTCSAWFPRGTSVTLAWISDRDALGQFNVVDPGGGHHNCAGHPAAARRDCTLTLDADATVKVLMISIPPPPP